ncbi:aldehyde dehydrogenase family protein [Clostridium sp.]|uniref:aldehyde dehydrogenase family protein n=1 Tax=Clostridium sp. TaxID=1506 RepID=UPI0029069212|nr:aldehyde dehydrogenase family protein [Clostridium sp.]MDU5106308.1 aldehyde dehydrogenase family protein [Clostridium sp.]
MKKYTKQYINGEWRSGSSSSILENKNPYTNEVLYTYKSANEQDVKDAYEAAYEASKLWASISPSERIGYLEGLVKVFEEEKETVYDVIREEGGSSLAKCDFEFFTSISIIKLAMSYPERMKGTILPSNIPGKENYIIKEPKGVIGVIAPWNVPLVLAMRSVIPAIALGNTVVLKPASDTPASSLMIADFFDKAGFPKGVINVVVGKGSEIGDSIVSNPIPSLISFTGSTEVGRHVGEVAGYHLKDVSLELGGNNAMVVLKDADIDQAVNAAVFGSLFNQGQVCMALNRILVPEEIHDDFVEALVKKVKSLKVGNPADPEVFIGPIINSSQIEKIENYIEGTIKQGAKVVLEGKTEGSVVYPWILTDVKNDMPTACNEVFGPVISIIRTKNEEEAIAIANDTIYGLSGSVFTKDIYHGMEVAKQIKSGMVHVNDQSINDEPHVMFGGEKASGLGRFNGEWVINKFTTDRWISVQGKERKFF